MRALPCYLVVLLAACGPLSPPRTDAGPDGGAEDAGLSDAGAGDAGVDAGPPDAGEAPDGGPCDGGFCAPERLAAERIDPWDLAVDGTHVYWLEYGLATNGLDGEVNRLPKGSACLKRDAGCVEDLNTQPTGRFRVDALTVAGDELCWTEAYANARDVVCQGLVSRAERFLARNQPGATRPIAADGALWWVNYGTSAATADGQVMRKALSASAATAPTAVVSQRAAPTAVAVGPTHFAWSESGPAVGQGAVLAAPLDGGAPFAVATGLRTPLSVAQCGPTGALYWVTYEGDTVMRGALAPDSGVVLVPGQKRPFQLACDGEHLFWLNVGVSANGADGELWQARLDGSEAVVMVRGISLAWAMAVDDAYVYYIAQGTQTRLEGEVWRVRKVR